MASPVRLLHRIQVVLALLHFAISVLQEVSVDSFLVTPFLMAIQAVTGFPRACSQSCDWVCNRSRCACSLIFSLLKISKSCDNDVGDVGEVEQEERVDKILDNEEHEVLPITSNKTAVVPNFALYPRFVESDQFHTLKSIIWLKLCSVLRKLQKISLNTALRNTREIASQFSLSFFALWTRLFSADASRIVVHALHATRLGRTNFFPCDVPCFPHA